MTIDDFNIIVENRLEKIKSILVSKSKEYVTGEDRLSNFKEGAVADGVTSEEVLWGYYRKHWLSVRKIVRDAGDNNYPSLELLHEKITDSINYHILLEAIVTENIKKNENMGNSGPTSGTR